MRMFSMVSNLLSAIVSLFSTTDGVNPYFTDLFSAAAFYTADSVPATAFCVDSAFGIAESALDTVLATAVASISLSLKLFIIAMI